MLRALIIVSVLVAAQSPASSVHAGRKCFDWSVAAPIVKKEGLAGMDKLSALARLKKVGELLRAKLCEERGSFSYRLTVRGPKGRLRGLSVDARRPFER